MEIHVRKRTPNSLALVFPCLEELAEYFLMQKLNKLNVNVLLHTASIPPWLSNQEQNPTILHS